MSSQMNGLCLDQFYGPATVRDRWARPEYAIKTLTLQGIKDLSIYDPDGCLLSPEETVELFNVILQLELTAEEKQELVAFMGCL